MITSRRSNPDLPRHAFGVDDDVSLSFQLLLQMPFSLVVTLTGRYWVTLAERRSPIFAKSMKFLQKDRSIAVHSCNHDTNQAQKPEKVSVIVLVDPLFS